MDGLQFDAWTRKVMTGVHGRRAALKTVFAASAAGLLGHGASDETAAAPRCPNRTGCTARCTDTRRECSCIRRSNGDRVCVHQCCSDRRCDRDNQCHSTEVCMQTECCTRRGTFCAPKCSERRPAYCDAQANASAAGEDSGNAWGP